MLRDPLGLLIFALKMHVTTSVGTFALLFLLMDKRDEAQLIYFILRVKSTMFVVAGLYPAAMLGISTHSCLIAVDEGHPQQCINEAASSQAAFAVQFCFELIRLLLIVLAFLLLVCGYAVGGDEEIAALEYQRLHNSTPPPPAASHHHSNSNWGKEEEEEGRGGGGGSGAGAASSASDKPSRPPPPPPLANAPPMASPRMGDPSIIQKQLDEQRDKMGAAPAFEARLTLLPRLRPSRADYTHPHMVCVVRLAACMWWGACMAFDCRVHRIPSTLVSSGGVG